MTPQSHATSSDVAVTSSPQSPVARQKRRPSLHRLGSLSNLNPFNRRRSSQGTLNSTDDEHSPHGTDKPPSSKTKRRQSYMQIQEDPLPELPKSRTFSNLPLTRTRWHSSKPPRQSMGPPTVPPSRIPTPSSSLNTKSRLASATKGILKVGPRQSRGLVRSDTEPLLKTTRTHSNPTGSAAPRPALKENSSPSKPAFKPPGSDPRTPVQRRPTGPRRPHTPLKTPKRLPTPETPSATMIRKTSVQPVTLSSPLAVTHQSRRQSMLPPAPVHPLRANKPKRLSYSSEIRTHSLLTPLVADAPRPMASPRASSTVVSSSSSLDLAAEHVTQAQSTAYWSGRLMAQLDRQRNEHMKRALAHDEAKDSFGDVDMRACLGILQKTCVTDTARMSFSIFKARCHLTAGVVVPIRVETDREKSVEVEVQSVEVAKTRDVEDQQKTLGVRKSSFVDRLLGKNKK